MNFLMVYRDDSRDILVEDFKNAIIAISGIYDIVFDSDGINAKYDYNNDSTIIRYENNSKDSLTISGISHASVNLAIKIGIELKKRIIDIHLKITDMDYSFDHDLFQFEKDEELFELLGQS